MSLKKVIYISTMPYSDKIKRDWYAKVFVENNFNVEFWDISNISNNIEIKKEETILDGIKLVNNITYHELSKLLINNKKLNIIYIIVASFHKKTSKIYRMLNKYKPYTVFFNWGDTPEAMTFRKKSFYEKLLMLKNNQLPFKNSLSNIMGAIYCKIIKNLGLIKIHDIYFNAGIKSNSIVKARKTIDINLCDYDQYLKNLKIKSRLSNYTVFIDSNLTANSDIRLNNLKKIDSKKYFNSLLKYFDLFEKKHNTKIVISAHPTSNYINNEFNGREVSRLQTAKLVADAKYVLSHHSTAISYAILNYKPMNFLMIDQWVGEYEEYANYEIAKSLNCKLINIDKINSSDPINISQVDKDLYDDYKYNYIAARKTEGLTSSSIILNEFNKYFEGKI